MTGGRAGGREAPYNGGGHPGPSARNTMADDPERSAAGNPIYRHQSRERDFELAHGDEQSIEAIGRHIERHVGPVAGVFHELVSDLVHVDVHRVAPTRERPYHTLVTSGMSDRPMAAPEGCEECRFAELVICLPPDWRVEDKDFKDERNYWPFRWLKVLARLPHEYQTWLYEAHTVPNGDPPEPFADDTKLCGVALARPTLFGPRFGRLKVAKGKVVEFLTVLPLYEEEMTYKLAKGFDALAARLHAAGVTELLDLRRRNVCKKRFGIF